MKTKLLKMVIITILTNTLAFGANPLYTKAGTVDIIDHKAMVAGSKAPGKDIFHITLEDTGIITGHICGCTTVAFLVTKNVLKKLYPDTAPLRRGVDVAISTYNMDIIDAITYLTGTRYNRSETKYDFMLDPTLQGREGTIKPKVGKKTATKAEIMKLAKTQQQIVKKIITKLPKESIIYQEVK